MHGSGLLLIAILAQAPAGVVSGPGGPPAGRYVAGGGLIYRWDGAAPVLTPTAPLGGLPPGSAILHAVPYAEGRRLLVLTTQADPGGKKHSRREGRALVLDTTEGVPRLVAEIALEGEPFDAAVTPDGSRAYVLSRRAAATGGESGGQHWVHEIDLAGGRLAGNTLLASAASGIAVEPSGRRVFVALRDRIQSCSTGPITTSWIYRSPGPNGDLAVRPDTGTLCVGRGDQVALFDPAAIAARSAADRHDRIDDATGVVRLPFNASGLSLSGDGRLAVVQGANRLAFLDCSTLALTWPSDLPAEITAAEEILPLAFPNAGQDLLLATFPGARVAAIRSPAPATPAEPLPAAPAEAPAPHMEAPPPQAPPPQEAPPPEAPPREAPPKDGQAQEAPPGPRKEPAAAPAAAEFLSGEMSGDFSRVQAIVLYGPNNITREFARVRPEPDGTWRMPLPPPGVYRVVPAGDGAAPLPAAPGFISVRVESGKGQSGIDFTLIYPR